MRIKIEGHLMYNNSPLKLEPIEVTNNEKGEAVGRFAVVVNGDYTKGKITIEIRENVEPTQSPAALGPLLKERIEHFFGQVKQLFHPPQ